MENKFISFGKCSHLYLYILGSVLFKFLESFLLGYKNNNTKFSLYDFVPILYDYNFMKSIYAYIGYIFFGLLFFIILIKRNKKHNGTSKKNKLKGIIHNKTNKKPKNIYFQIFIFSLLLVFHIETKKVLYNLDFQAFNIWTFDIIFMLIIMKKNFIIYYYKHQKFAILFIVIASSVSIITSSFLPFKIEDGKYINSYKVAKQKGSYLLSFPLILFFVFLSYIYSYSRVSGKLLMQIHFFSSYTLIFYAGIVGLISTLTTSLISNKLEYEDNIFDYIEDLKQKFYNNKYEFYFEIFAVNITYSFIMFMEIIFELLTVYYLNPLFILITNNLCYGVIQLITFIVENKNDDGILILGQFLCEEFAEIFALLGYSIYLEIIELHFCELDKNLKRNIITRGDIELKEIIDIGNNTYNDDEDEEDDEDKDGDDYNEQEENDKETKYIKTIL